MARRVVLKQDIFKYFHCKRKIIPIMVKMFSLLLFTCNITLIRLQLIQLLG